VEPEKKKVEKTQIKNVKNGYAQKYRQTVWKICRVSSDECGPFIEKLVSVSR